MGIRPTPEVDAPEPGRFVEIGQREAPDADGPLPLVFDAAAVAALEPKPDGRFAMHLVGGQVILLQPPIASAVFRALRLGAGAASGPKPRPKRLRRPATSETAPETAQAARRRSEPRINQGSRAKQQPKTWWASAAAVVASYIG